ncbi:hypothetical protein HPB47_001393 [Ixodes persulcatus]|uniref:Uncharacterized protein n=1 Tax=Ixodes persulcatus TaxID=34615 RepID=A0AC60PP59_IXOPE|nr:hypothetical protein HPB47_001393 [Ixodes persulcatus]
MNEVDREAQGACFAPDPGVKYCGVCGTLRLHEVHEKCRYHRDRVRGTTPSADPAPTNLHATLDQPGALEAVLPYMTKKPGFVAAVLDGSLLQLPRRRRCRQSPGTPRRQERPHQRRGPHRPQRTSAATTPGTSLWRAPPPPGDEAGAASEGKREGVLWPLGEGTVLRDLKLFGRAATHSAAPPPSRLSGKCGKVVDCVLT